MEKLKSIKSCLVSSVQSQLGDLQHVDTKELGEVIDMIKDLEEAMYYCSIIEAMEKASDEQERGMNINYYMEPRDSMGRYTSSSTGGSRRNYTPYMEYAPYMMRDAKWRDERTGDRSSWSRHMYMENKQYHGNDESSMEDLEHYIKDLGEDLTDMVKSSTTEEKQLLSSKLQQLANKINK